MEREMLKKIGKWILGIISLAIFIMLGRKLFPHSQDERAWHNYQRQKKKFDKEKETLDQENEVDQKRIAEIEKEIENINRNLLKRTAQTKDEIKKIDEMSAEEVANVTTEQERRLAERLGYYA